MLQTCYITQYCECPAWGWKKKNTTKKKKKKTVGFFINTQQKTKGIKVKL